jgi:twitching motility protein PilT
MRGFDLLAAAATQRASDIHLVPGQPPMIRVENQLIPLGNNGPLTSKEIQEFILPLLNERQRDQLAREFCVDFSIEVGANRCRGNVLFQRNGVEAVFRLIPAKIPSPEDLLLPNSVLDLASLKNGLVLIAGSTGAGKSTTLACLINLINEQRRGNIITIEDPIEYLHASKNCMVSQREIGMHAPSFSSALRYVMRQDPDVVMVGEMRDLETISAAISVAETGHLVFATLHSNDAVQAIDRVIDVFPGEQQPQIRAQLSSVLRAVVSQFLIPRSNGKGLVAVREIMIVNSAIRNLIRASKVHEIYSAMEMGYREGMVTFSRSLAELVSQGIIDPRYVNTVDQNSVVQKKSWG